MGQSFHGVDSSYLSTQLKEELDGQSFTQQADYREQGHKILGGAAAHKGREGLDFILAEVGMQREEVVPQDPTRILHTAHDVSLATAELVSDLNVTQLQTLDLPQLAQWQTINVKSPCST